MNCVPDYQKPVAFFMQNTPAGRSQQHQKSEFSFSSAIIGTELDGRDFHVQLLTRFKKSELHYKKIKIKEIYFYFIAYIKGGSTSYDSQSRSRR